VGLEVPRATDTEPYGSGSALSLVLDGETALSFGTGLVTRDKPPTSLARLDGNAPDVRLHAVALIVGANPPKLGDRVRLQRMEERVDVRAVYNW